MNKKRDKASLEKKPAPVTQAQSNYHAGMKRRKFSPLMMRVMAVNVVALAILIFGLLYLNKFRDNLIESRIVNLEKQAVIIAGALGEGAVAGPDSVTIDVVDAEQILSRLVAPTDNRAKLFSISKELLLDSQYITAETTIYEKPLPDPDQEKTVMEYLEGFLHKALDLMMVRKNLPYYEEHAQETADDYHEVMVALTGQNTRAVRQVSGGEVVVTVAVPVTRFRRVLGALLLTANTSDIDEIVRAEQLFTLKVFAAALAVTLFLSFFLGRTIAHPIGRLARAAERVRRAIGREENIPEFASRNDEIGDLSRSLSEMTRALYNQIDAIERFAADVAHELKNPLTSMRSALETLERTNKPEQQKQLMAILADDVQRLDRLISDISDASRLDGELARAEMAVVDLGLMLNTIVDAYRSTRAHSGVSITFEHGVSDIYLVFGIRSRLGQVWRNLIDNAYSFSTQGQTVKITLEIEDGFVVLKVLDQGVGLPKGSEEKIFERFYSERPANEEFGRHSGLGLAISKQVIEAHGGTIRAMNNVNDGAAFVVSLPLAKKPKE